MKSIFLVIGLLLGMSMGVNAQSSVTVDVTGVKEQGDKLYIALYDSKAPFLSAQALTGKIVEVKEQTMKVTFDDLEDGEYAIAMFLDENSNGKLDLGIYGIPSEKYGFSNNIDPALLQRPPIFDECKFNVKGDARISIRLVSAIK